MVRVGIVGLGFMGRMHYSAYARIADAQVVAVCDADPRRAAGDLSGGWSNVAGATVERLPMDRIRGTTDPQALFEMPEVDVIDICLPTPAHRQIATAALASGKHVLCEKPMALTSGDARAIAHAAAQARGYFMPAMCVRFWSEWEWLKQTIQEERYGALRSLSLRRLGTMPQGWFSNGDMSGGAIIDMHVHDTDFVLDLLGMPAAVFSRGYRGGSGQIDHIMTQYLFEATEAPIVSAEGSWTMAEGYPFAMRYIANFVSATADYDSSRTPALQVYVDGKAEHPVLNGEDGYTRELRYFIECVRDGRRPTRVTAEDAVEGLEIVEAEKRSIASGRAERVRHAE